MIGVVNRKQQELVITKTNQLRHTMRLKFWERLLEKMNEKSELYKNVNPSKDNWITCGCGYNGLNYGLVITGKFASVGLYADTGSQDKNKQIYDKLFLRKAEIEKKFNAELEWDRKDKKIRSQIVYTLQNVDIFNEDDWDTMVNFLVENMIKLEAAMRDELKAAILAKAG